MWRRRLVSFAAGALAASLIAGAAPAPTTAAPTCHLAGTWTQTTDQVGSTVWTITANGKATEGAGSSTTATGSATLSGNDLTITWTSATGSNYAGRYHWTLDAQCHGTGKLIFTRKDPGDTRQNLDSTVVGPAPTEPPSNCGTIASAHTAAVNEVRVAAVQPDVVVHRAGTPENEVRVLCKGAVLQQGDEIACDPDGSVTLQFADNSTVVVKNTTQLKIASFFTEGGVVKTEILLKMGEIAAKIHRSEATKSDFRIKSPTGTTSVRDPTFSVFYDPGARATLTTVTAGVATVDPVKPGLPTVRVPAGKEVEVTASSISKVAPIGKADARGGLNRRDALTKVLKIVAKINGPCGISTPRSNAFAVMPRPGGWGVTVNVIGKLKGPARWTVKGQRVTPSNALAKVLARGCR